MELCAGLEACVGVDMHLTKPRCFLNEGSSCAAVAHEDLISTSDYYRLIWKQNDHADDGMLDVGKGPIYEPTAGAHARRLTAIARDLGYSWPWLLRFPVSLHAPGEYKVCFCDATLVESKGSGAKCDTERDFGVLVGTVHASSVACLIEAAKFRRSSSSCVEMYHGGLRCDVATPAFPTLPAGPELPSMANTDAVGALWASCQLRPEREDEVICHALQHFYGAHHLEADQDSHATGTGGGGPQA